MDEITTSSPAFAKPRVMRSAFCLLGGSIYMNWFLPTNWRSKNPLFKLFYFRKKQIGFIDYKERLQMAKTCFIIHLVLGIIYFLIKSPLWLNLWINLYPMLVQLYIGYRCWVIVKKRSVS